MAVTILFGGSYGVSATALLVVLLVGLGLPIHGGLVLTGRRERCRKWAPGLTACRLHFLPPHPPETSDPHDDHATRLGRFGERLSLRRRPDSLAQEREMRSRKSCPAWVSRSN
jgi:hypothetical protein